MKRRKRGRGRHGTNEEHSTTTKLCKYVKKVIFFCHFGRIVHNILYFNTETETHMYVNTESTAGLDCDTTHTITIVGSTA